MTAWLLIAMLYTTGPYSTATSFTVELPTLAECKRVAKAITLRELKYQCVEIRK